MASSSEIEPVAIDVPSADAMRELGIGLAQLLVAGDLVLASGDLGAGKTTLTQGIGLGLGVRDSITSPTFVLSRIHCSTTGRPDLVHVDAYRLNGSVDFDDLDLDADAESVITLVEWGSGRAEGLNPDRLEITIVRPSGDQLRFEAASSDEPRQVFLTPVGDRWAEVDLAALRGSR